MSYIRRLLKITRKLYTIRDAMFRLNVNYLLQIESEVIAKGHTFLTADDSSNQTFTESSLLEQYASAFTALESRSLDIPIFSCISCEKLFSKSQVIQINNIRKPLSSDIWKKIKAMKEEESVNGYICRSCREKIGKDVLPATCILNDLFCGSQPEVIQCLNTYEKILIQRAKTFQVVSKMQTVGKKGRNSHALSKTIGRSFHLPLPLEETLKRLPQPTDPINSNAELYVIVRGVPTKSKNVWQMLVDLNKVYMALGYLKYHNELYKNIILPKNADDLLDHIDDSIMFDMGANIDNHKCYEEPELQRRSMLTQVAPSDWEAEESHYTIHVLHESKQCKGSTELYKMLKVDAIPLGYQNKDIDLLCFPDLFPEGKFGQFHPRKVKLTSSEFIKSRLLSKHPQFRLNQQYLFFLLHDANLRQLQQGIFHKLNVTGYKTALTAGDCLRSIESGDMEGNLTSIFAKLRNTSQYWVQPRNDVNCMAQNYGPATWFLTLSPSEWNWDDLQLFIKRVNATVPDIEKKSTSQLIAMDPVSASKFIDIKFTAMLDFIMSNDAPLGKVVHYFYRREYQSRGLQHFHLLLWVRDAPILGTSTKEEVVEFILKYASCRLPDLSSCPTLYSRVTSYQSHHHNAYCIKNKKTKSGFRKVCRFGFPRAPTENVVLRDIVEAVAGRKSLRSHSRLYDLPRTPQEVNINDYNPAVLLAWNGNMDLQFVGDATSLLHWYVTKYTTKSEKSHIVQTFDDINSTKSLASRLFNIGLRSLNNRECGSLEASDTLLGIPLYGTDPDTTIKWLDVAMNRRKRLHKIDRLKNLSENSTEIFYESWVDDHYPNRPLELDEMCLYDFVRWFNLSNTPLKTDRESYRLPNGKFLIKRIKPCLINHYKYSVHQEPERYHYALLLMFLPWRSTDELKSEFSTYTESFIQLKGSLKFAAEYADRLEQILQQADEARVKIQTRVAEIAAEDNGEAAEKALGDPNDMIYAHPDEPDAIPQVTNYGNPTTSDSPFSELHSKLNTDQLRVFEHVCNRLSSSDNSLPLNHFVSGVGGTGKSYLIKTISQWTKDFLDAPTSISAPTGLSAYNINGFTIYRVFQLPVEHGRTPKFRPLSDDMLKQLRYELKNVVLFIIDEISMVSNFTLMCINLRLCEIFNTMDQQSGWFGRKHILVFGDLLQLAPVHEGSPFVELDAHQLNKYFGALSSINIWKELFTYDELTINMRQAEDARYADILSRVRIGHLSSNDVSFLTQKRIQLTGSCLQENIAHIIKYLSSLPPDTVCLCSTSTQCNRLNEEMMKCLEGSAIQLVAKDSVDCDPRKRSKAMDFLNAYDKDCSRTAGMDRIITVKLGAKIMLRRNIDVSLGLVNSAIGTISSFNFDVDSPNEISSLVISFQNGITHALERITAKFEVFDKAFIFRQQFPISTAYAVTIHKCQGLSLTTVLIDIGESIFTCAQSYVALSRVKSSKGLHLINFNPRAVKAQSSAVLEYNRLRLIHRSDLPLIDCSNTSGFTVPYFKDRIWCVSRFVSEVQERTNVLAGPPHPTTRRAVPSAFQLRGLNNPNIACYSNSIAQLLYSHPALREIIKSTDVCLPLKDHLKMYESLPSTISLDTSTLRAIPTSGEYLQTQQKDCTEFLLALLDENLGLRRPFALVTSTTKLCSSCNYTSRVENPADVMIRVPVTIRHGSLENYIDSVVNSWDNVADFICEFCQQANTTRDKVSITQASRLILINFLIFNNALNKLRDVRVTSVPSARVLIAGKFYKPVAAIFHFGDTLSSGHYVTYIRSGTGWMCADDNSVSRKRWPTNGANIYLLLLEQC